AWCEVRRVKPPERTFRRSQLSLRLLEFNEDKRLGMPRAASQPPSKPVHPRYSVRSGTTIGTAKATLGRFILPAANPSGGRLTLLPISRQETRLQAPVPKGVDA